MGKSWNTKNGFNYYTAMSAFQKAIRRCDENQTVFWGIELYESGNVQHLWNRIYVIIHEDIGLAEPDITGRVNHLKHAHDYLEKHRPGRVSKKLVFLQLLLMLARAKKSRLVDTSYMYYWHQHDELAKSIEIPDYVFDMHTYKGKKMGRGIQHFYDEAAHINNRANLPGEEIMEQFARQIDLQDEKNPSPKKEKPEDNNLFNQ
jgi:replication-associated recombination protein RarA